MTSDNVRPQASRPLRAVFFDLAGTLIHVRGGLGYQYARVAADFGIQADPGAMDVVFSDAFRAAGPEFTRDSNDEASVVPARPDPGRTFWRRVVRGVYDRIGVAVEPSTFDRYFDRLFDHFALAEAWDLYPDVEPALDRLEREGLILAVVSNFDSRVVRLLPALGLDRFFRTLAVPAYAGAAKPDCAIFRYALGRHGLAPEEAVQVGDSVENDLQAARAAGVGAVLLDRSGRHAGVAPSIRSLEELPRRLGLRA